MVLVNGDYRHIGDVDRALWALLIKFTGGRRASPGGQFRALPSATQRNWTRLFRPLRKKQLKSIRCAVNKHKQQTKRKHLPKQKH